MGREGQVGFRDLTCHSTNSVGDAVSSSITMGIVPASTLDFIL